jgi:hypothetical protein
MADASPGCGETPPGGKLGAGGGRDAGQVACLYAEQEEHAERTKRGSMATSTRI